MWVVFGEGQILSAGFSYPDPLEIQPFSGRALSATVSVPGSKSITNRALVLAALASQREECELTNALQSEDTEVMVECLTRLGFRVEVNWPTVRIARNLSGRIIPAESADLFVANSGTTVRFLTAMLALGHGTYRLDGVPRMRERPIRDLLNALTQIGAQATSDNDTGCPPITLKASGIQADLVHIRADVSSQFLSALLMAAPHTGRALTIRVDGPVVSEPYIEMTLSMMVSWGSIVSRSEPNEYRVQSVGETLLQGRYAIEPDASAASYFFAAAAILGGRVTVQNLSLSSLQGDVHFVGVLQQMGCRVETCDAGITVHGGALQGVDVDMNAISDTVMTLGAVACFAEGPTRIRNVAHIRHKETDRIAALATELRRLGAAVEEFEDGLKITPRPLHGAAVDTYHDHRMAMSLALIGLKVPGVGIKNPGCVAKTYPGFWQDLLKVQSQK